MANNNQNGGKPEEDHLFDNVREHIRRFTDHHISSMLHSLIGLPSMLNPPPAGSTWVIIDEDLINPPASKRDRAYSDGDGRLEGKTMEEIQALKSAWIAEREGGDSSGKNKPEKQDSDASSSSSSSGSPRRERAVYVFRFPHRPHHGAFSDLSSSPDSSQQVDRLSDTVARSLFHEFDRFFNPFFSTFGLPHPFIFSPFWGYHHRHNHHRDRRSMEDNKDDLLMDPFAFFNELQRSVWEEEERGFREASRVRTNNNTTSTYPKIIPIEEIPETGPRQPSPPPLETESPKVAEDAPPHNAAPQLQRQNPASTETEFDAYKCLEAVTSPPPAQFEIAPISGTDTPRTVATSTSTQTRTLPDGSTFTKTVTVKRYEDGTEERTENQNLTPARSGDSGKIQGNRVSLFSDDDMWSMFGPKDNGDEKKERRGGVLDMVKRKMDNAAAGSGGAGPVEAAEGGAQGSGVDRGDGKGSGWGWFWRK